MDLRLKGKRALITGSTAGIGFAAAVGLARGCIGHRQRSQCRASPGRG